MDWNTKVDYGMDYGMGKLMCSSVMSWVSFYSRGTLRTRLGCMHSCTKCSGDSPQKRSVVARQLSPLNFVWPWQKPPCHNS